MTIVADTRPCNFVNSTTTHATTTAYRLRWAAPTFALAAQYLGRGTTARKREGQRVLGRVREWLKSAECWGSVHCMCECERGIVSSVTNTIVSARRFLQHALLQAGRKCSPAAAICR